MGRNRYAKNNNEPLISIITPVHDRLEWVPLTLQSLSDQTYKRFEVIVINDFGESPKEILNHYPNLDITYVEHSENLGLASARNTGMANAKGDYFVFLDSDDQLMPLALEFRMSMIKKYEAEVVYTRGLRDIYERRGDTYVLVNNTTYWTCGFNRDLLLIQNIAQCNSVLFSRKAWDISGNYKLDHMLKSGEDFDFWEELSRKNDFIELKLLDCNCSYRLEGNQMTGTLNFAADLPRIYGKRRHTAINKNYVIEGQNAILRQSGIHPEDYGL
jgi:glycosyltransferase involved in cell wall biosynthesis